MPRFAANLSMMFNELAFLDRFAAARKAGFEAVEFLFPYDYPAAELRRRLDDNGLTQALFNMPPGDWQAGERGIAALPGRQAAFRDGVKRALDYAGGAGLQAAALHGRAGAGRSVADHRRQRLRRQPGLGGRAGAAGRREAGDRADQPSRHAGLFPEHAGAGRGHRRGDRRDRIGLQFDVYHCQTTEGDVTKRMEKHLPVIAHMQIADVPARNEPGTGEIGWDYVFRRMDELGYTGWVGCEYRPAGETLAGLGWRQKFGV